MQRRGDGVAVVHRGRRGDVPPLCIVAVIKSRGEKDSVHGEEDERKREKRQKSCAKGNATSPSPPSHCFHPATVVIVVVKMKVEQREGKYKRRVTIGPLPLLLPPSVVVVATEGPIIVVDSARTGRRGCKPPLELPTPSYSSNFTSIPLGLAAVVSILGVLLEIVAATSIIRVDAIVAVSNCMGDSVVVVSSN